MSENLSFKQKIEILGSATSLAIARGMDHDVSAIYHNMVGLVTDKQTPEVQVAAVPIEESVQPDYIVCLETGRKFKMLRRHLATMGMTPDMYRMKWGLRSDYPMTAPNYSKLRSRMATKYGLGKGTRRVANG